MTKESTPLRDDVTQRIQKIVGRPVPANENLLDEAVDSLALVEIINMVDDLAKQKKIDVNLDALISEDSLTTEMIVQTLSANP